MKELMKERQTQIFRYKGDNFETGGELIDKQVSAWYRTHTNHRVLSLQDERKMEVTPDLTCECIINVIMEYVERDGTEDE
jgi:hypothetical protein